MALPLQLLFHFFNHFPGLTFIGSPRKNMGTFLSYGRNKDEEFCLLGHAQPECSNSFSVLDLSLTSVSSLLKIKIKFGYIILRSSQTAVFEPPGSRSVYQRYRSGSGFESGFRIWVLLSSRKKIRKTLISIVFLVFL